MTLTEQAQALIDGGFMQTSRAYGRLGRVPPGVTAIEALYAAEMALLSPDLSPKMVAYWEQHYRKWCAGLRENGCRRHYARVHAKGTDRRDVSPALLREFRRLGGEAA